MGDVLNPLDGWDIELSDEENFNDDDIDYIPEITSKGQAFNLFFKF